MRRSRGDIWVVDLTDARGHEQSGLRPAVVVAVSYGDMTIVVPFTTPAADPDTASVRITSAGSIVILKEDRSVCWSTEQGATPAMRKGIGSRPVPARVLNISFLAPI